MGFLPNLTPFLLPAILAFQLNSPTTGLLHMLFSKAENTPFFSPTQLPFLINYYLATSDYWIDFRFHYKSFISRLSYTPCPQELLFFYDLLGHISFLHSTLLQVSVNSYVDYYLINIWPLPTGMWAPWKCGPCLLSFFFFF